MCVTIREVRPEDARRFLEIHHGAVRGIAAKDYPTSDVEAWAGPITDHVIKRFLANRDREIRLVAEIDGQPVGVGAIVLSGSELRACYVAPSAARRGVGSAIVAKLEQIARDHGLDFLELESSITAEPFYSALGYRVVSRGEHFLSPGGANGRRQDAEATRMTVRDRQATVEFESTAGGTGASVHVFELAKFIDNADIAARLVYSRCVE